MLFRSFVLATGGGTPIPMENRVLLKQLGTVIYLKCDREILYKRIIAKEIPAYFPYHDDPKRSFDEIIIKREREYEAVTDYVIDCKLYPPKKIAEIIISKV